MGLWNSIKKGLGMKPGEEGAKPPAPAAHSQSPASAAPSGFPAPENEPASTLKPAGKIGEEFGEEDDEGASGGSKAGIIASGKTMAGRLFSGKGGSGKTTAGKVVVEGQGAPLKDKHRRRAIRDARLEPKASKVHYIDREPYITAEESKLLFSDTYRTNDRKLRSLLADPQQLQRWDLPHFESLDELARALGISIGELKWLATHRKADSVLHYVTFAVPKRSGGERVIMAPKKRLKAVQDMLLELVVRKLPVSAHAHGFVPKRSVKTNAQIHAGKAILLKMDLKDFFPTVHFGRVRGLLVSVGYGYTVATAMACLMTEAVRQPVETGGKTVYVPVGSRHCVQGAPTSPGVCNSVVHRLDRRLAGLAKRMGCAYSRYADDLTFSGPADMKVAVVHAMAKRLIEAEGFVVNGKKTKVSRAGSKQEVTGVNVAKGVLGISRKERRKVRAAIHQIKNMSSKEPGYDLKRSQVQGRIGWVTMINEMQGRELKVKLPNRKKS
jgi:RNA-directed DNA polymerase